MKGLLGNAVAAGLLVVAFSVPVALGSYAGVKDKQGYRPPSSKPAQVLSIKARIGLPDVHYPSEKIDLVTVVIARRGTGKNFYVQLVPFYHYREDMSPTVMKVSRATTYVPKPNDNSFPKWVFRLKNDRAQKVVFEIRNSGDDTYCVGNPYYQLATGRFTLCSK